MTMHPFDYQHDMLRHRLGSGHHLDRRVSHVLRPRPDANATRRRKMWAALARWTFRRPANPNRTTRFGEPEQVSGAWAAGICVR
jgi:hypothetical protein